MLGPDLKAWRDRNGYTQARLAMTLDVSRQTLNGWEKSDGSLPRTVALALLALEHLPEKCSLTAGERLTAAEYRQERKRASAVGDAAD
jgi:DNA-binding XRE family transcriptional regulator